MNLALDESKVKLRLSYNALLLRPEEQQTISNDEDFCVYLASIDNNCICVLFVEVITKPELPKQMSKTNKNYVGKNYEDLHSKNDEIRDNAIILYLDKEQGKQ